MTNRSVSLTRIEELLDQTFAIKRFGVDPAFSRFIPMVYDPIGFDWHGFFEPEFTERFNGAMIRGESDVSKIWCISFPRDSVLEWILARARPGDVIFSHHPIDMECGDPKGAKGRGFIPIPKALLQAVKSQGLTFFSCHVPLDFNPGLSTSDAIVHLLGGTVTGAILQEGKGYAGRVCDIRAQSIDDLVRTCTAALGLPYVDVQGQISKERITRVAVIAGGAGNVTFYEEADRVQAGCLIAGEVTSKIDNDLGRQHQAEIEQYLLTTGLSAIGLSHAASEFAVMQELVPFFEKHTGVPAEAVAESHWWR
jgi:putative NIF3 family GTP cyclohydrolase 1 type 2